MLRDTHYGRGRQFIPSQRSQSTESRGTFPQTSNNCVRNFWRESSAVAKGVHASCPSLVAPERRFIKMEVSNPKFSDIKAIPRAAHPVATPRSAPRDCAAAVTQINKNENAKTILGWLAG
jgi:hypothetical protein